MPTNDSERLRCTYRIACADEGAAVEIAHAIAREQSLEVPPGVGGAQLEERLLGRLDAVAATGDGAFDVAISFARELVGDGLPNLLNVAYGNVSLMNGVRLVGVEVPARFVAGLPGPRFGIDGVRRLVGVEERRPLVACALKPVGLGTTELADLARRFVLSGADVVKDDHGLVDQASSPFAERVVAVARAVEGARGGAGGAGYFPNVTGPPDGLDERLRIATDAGCAGVVVCPGLMGLDAVRAIAAGPRHLAVMAHPSHAQTAPDRPDGIAPEVLLGTLYRLAGADAVVYVNAGGRFRWPVTTCEAINERLREPWGRLLPALPTPAGGVREDEAGAWLDRYGPDTMLLIGGSLLASDDVSAATRRVVAAARPS